MNRLSSEELVGLSKRLDQHVWGWSMDETASMLDAVELTPLRELGGTSVRIGHPDLPGAYGSVVNFVDRSIVLRVNVTLTEIVTRDDEERQRILDAAFQEYEAALSSVFGGPEYREKSAAVWDRGNDLLKLRRLGVAVDISRENKRNSHIAEGG